MANETFKLGATKWAYKDGSLLAYNDVNNNFKPLPFTFERSSLATKVNEDGLIETVRNNIPRIDYTDNPNGHLLLEPERTNWFFRSNEFNVSPWNSPSSSALLTANQDGIFNTNTAWKLIQNTNTGYHYITQSVTLTGNYIYSIYAKAGECKGISFYVPRPTAGSGSGVTAFNLDSGTYLLNEHNATSESLGDGWYRLSLQVYLNGSGNMTIYVIQTIQQSETGDGVSGIYIQYAQLEAGNYPTSYIPTSGATATRVAENCRGAGNAQVFNDSEGVLYAEIAALVGDDTYRQISISNGTNTYRHLISFYQSSIICATINNGYSYLPVISSSIAPNTLYKVAYKYKQDDFSFWINGVKVGESLTGNLPTGLSDLEFGNGVNQLNFYGKTKQIGVYDTALTDTELENLTTETSEFDSINPAAFVMRVKTYESGTSASNQFTIPTSGSGYNYTITTSDGQTITGNTGSTTITFTSAGIHDVAITGDFPRIYFNNGGDKFKLIDIRNWGDIGWTSMERAFFGCNNLTNVTASDVPDLSSVTDMFFTFRQCSYLTTLDVSLWDTGSITNMYAMFSFCSSLTTLDVSSWDTSSVTNMSIAFYGCSSLTTLDVSGWNTGSVTNMGGTFQNCTSLTTLDVSGWDTSNVTNMQSIFQNCTSLNTLNVGAWNTSSVTTMYLAFQFCSSLTTLDVSSWNTSSVTNMRDTFYNCSSLTDLDVSAWDIDQVTNFTNFAFGVTIPTATYDDILIAWEAQAPTSGISIHFGNSKYSWRAIEARNTLVNTYNWTITDGGFDDISDEFIFTVKTNNLSAGSTANDTFKLPLVASSTVNAIVDWGDGSSDVITAYNQAEVTHQYASIGTYEIKIDGVINGWQFNASGDMLKILDIKNWGSFDISTDATFYACYNLTQSATDVPTISSTSLLRIFTSCLVFNGDISNWDVSTVVNFYGSLNSCGLLKISLSNWDINQVTNFAFFAFGTDINESGTTTNYDNTLISWAAQSPQSNINIHFGTAKYSWRAIEARNTLINTYNWTITDGGFDDVSDEFIITIDTTQAGSAADTFVLPWIGTYDVDWGDGNVDIAVTNTQTHVYASSGIYDVKVTAATGRILFNNLGDKSKLIDIRNWGNIGWTSMAFSFAGCNQLTSVSASDIPNLSAVTDGGYMFYNCNQMTSLNVSNWDLSSFTSLLRAFAYCRNLSNLDVTGWNISNVISILSTFEDCDQFDYSLANWNINNITTANSFMLSAVGLSTANYDNTLIAWAAQSPQSNINIHFGTAKYTLGSAAEAARTSLRNNFGWTITDGGGVSGVLNQYTGAAAAYSLRNLSDATTNVVRVRRDSDNAELDFTYDGIMDVGVTGLANWVGVGNNGYVVTWYDQSGLGNHATQGTASAQPQIVASGVVNLVNGMPAILSDGVDDYLSVAFSATNPTTQFFVYDKVGTSGTLGGLFSGVNYTPALSLDSTGVYAYQSGPVFGPTYANNNQAVVSLKSSTTGTDWAMWGNGSSVTNSGENIGTLAPNNITLMARGGASLFGSAYFQEYIVYPSDQTSNQSAIESNINGYYSIY